MKCIRYVNVCKSKIMRCIRYVNVSESRMMSVRYVNVVLMNERQNGKQLVDKYCFKDWGHKLQWVEDGQGIWYRKLIKGIRHGEH